MKMAADVAATGKMGTDLLEQVSQANKLAVLGGIDQQKSLDTIISLTSAFGKETKALSEDINFLNAVENQTILNIDDLTTAIPKAAPVIKQLGGDVQDLAFFMTAMREGGIQAGEGANALKSGLASMINPTDKAAKSLGKMGINIKGIVEANKGDVKNLVIGMATAFDQLEPLKRAQAIEQLFGKFQFARISTLFQNVIKEGSQAQTVAKLTQATTEELAILSERELKKVEESPLYKFKKEVQDLKTAIAPVGAEFLKALTPIVKFFGNVFENFNNFGDGTKKVIVLLTAVLAGIGPLALMSFGLLANGIANIIKGFTAVKSLFNKTGSSTQILGEQTSYLTQEQLRAAGVAASLDQAHMKLTQRFTSEAAAVRNLSTAYQQAIATQSMFGLGAVRGKGGTAQQPKGYAKGVVSVPGSGTGDKVPAMLSPKEAVIPAPMAKKYAPLISGMIADNIPGFAIGYQNAHATMPFAPGSPQYLQALQTTSAAFQQFATKFPQMVNVVSNLVAKLPGVLNQQMKSPSGASVADFKKGYAANSGKFNLSAKLGGLDMADKNATAALQRLENEIGKRTIQLSKGTVTDQVFAQATKEVINEFMLLDASSKKAATALNNASQQVGQVRTLPKADLIRKGLATGEFQKIVGPKGGVRVAYKGEQIARYSSKKDSFRPADPRENARGYSAAAKKVKYESSKATQSLFLAAEKGINEGFQNQSPSKKMRKAAQDGAQGAIVGMLESVDDMKRAGRQLGQASVSGVYSSQSANAMYGKSTGITAADKSIRRQQEKLAKQNQMISVSNGSNGSKDKVAKDAKGPRAGMIGMAASTAVMGASMMGGKVGDTAQQLMMPIMMVSMLFGMMSAPLAAVVSLIGLLAFGIFKLNKAKKDEMKATLKLIDSMGTGIKPMQEFSKFAGTVTATEIMNRRRANETSPFQIKTGKTTFGESYVQSDEGKARVENVQKYMNKFGQPAAIQDLSSQLVGAVMTGALDYKQARSIAANIGDALGDYDFSIAVNGKLIELLGVNGENVLKNGLEIKTKLVEEQRDALTRGMDLTPFTSQVGVASSMASRQLVTNQYKQTFTESGETVFARMKNLLETQQQMLDVTEVEYQKKIEAAQIAGDTNEVNKLILQRDKERAALLDENVESYDAIQKVLASGSAKDIQDIRDSAKISVQEAYKDDPLGLALSNQAMTRIGESGATSAQKAMIELQLASKDLSPKTVEDMFARFESGEDIEQIINVSAQFGGKFADQMLAIANQFENKDKALDFVMSFSGKSDAEAQKQLDLFQSISKLGGIGEGIDVPILLNYAVSNQAKSKQAQIKLDKLANQKDLSKVSFAVEIVGQKALDELVARGQDWEKMPDEEKRTFLTTSILALELQGNPELQKAYLNWQKQAGNTGKSFAEYAGYAGYKVSEASAKDTAKIPGMEDGSDSSGGPTGSPLDDIVKKLRDVRKATQELTVGWNDSGNALKKLAKETLGFGGLAQKLRGEGAGQNTIDFITGLSPEDYDKYKSMFKDIKVLQQSLNSIAIGDYVEGQRKIASDSKNQAVAFNVLTKSGMSLADAYDAIKDSSFAATVAQAKGAEVLKLVKERQLTLKEIFDKDISTGQYSNQFDPGFDAAMKLFDIQEKLIRQKRKSELSAQQLIIDNSNKQIKLARNIQDANNYQIARYEDGLKSISDQAEAITEKYNKQFAALDKISKINEVISRQEKSRISIAEALSQGDIYAAARAAQELRAQNAQDAIDQQRTGMEE
jgi:TP901 family phage tail tape measure protein